MSNMSYIVSKNKISKKLIISAVKSFFQENFPELDLKTKDS